MTAPHQPGRAALVAAWAIGVGIGLIVLQLTWLVAARIASLFWSPPRGPTIAFLAAIVAGTVVSIVAGRRLSRRLIPEREIRES